MRRKIITKNIYVVGGYVRDHLLGTIAADKDFVAVGFSPDDFSDLPMVGKDFPVFLTECGDEIALARTERSNGKGYNAFDVKTENVTLEQDLSRRDLTINAMAVSAQGYEGMKPYDVIDPFNGLADIESKTLRHVSDAFKEDPVRVLRIARLRAKLPGFWRIAAKTKALIYSMRGYLTSLTQERVWKEVDRALECNPRIFFETLFELGVLDVIFPNIYQLTTLKEGSPYHMEPSLFVHTMEMLEEASKTGDKTLMLAALYHDIAKPHCYRTYGNGAGHDSWKLVAPLIDIVMPKKYEKALRVLIGNHIRIVKFFDMRPGKQVDLLCSYRRDSELFKLQLKLLALDDVHRESLENKKLSDAFYGYLVACFRKVQNYSPEKWINEQEKKPSGEAIAQEVKRSLIERVRGITKQKDKR